MRRLSVLSFCATGIIVFAGCQTTREPRFLNVDRPGHAPIAPSLQSARVLLSEPRYVQADRPGRSPLTPMLQNRSPWSPRLFANAGDESPPYAPVAPVLLGRGPKPGPLFADAQSDLRSSTWIRPTPSINDSFRRPVTLSADRQPIAATALKSERETRVSSSLATAKSCWESGDELAKCGLHEQAIQEYMQAVELNPQLASKAAWRCAKLHDKMRQSEKAWRAYQSALHEMPDDPDLLTDVGCFYASRGGHTESERWFRMALEKDMHHVNAWKHLSLALAAQGKSRETLKAIENSDPDAATLVAIGNALSKAGKRVDASKVYRLALDKDPTNQAAQIGLEEAEKPSSNPSSAPLDEAIRAAGRSPF